MVTRVPSQQHTPSLEDSEMMIKPRVFGATIVILTVVWSGCGEKSIKLRLKFNEGDEYKYQLTQDATTTTDIMGRKIDMPSTTEITLTQKVEKVNQGIGEISITCDSFSMEMNVGGKQIPSTMGESMVGKTEIMKLSENGEIREPQGIRSIVALQGLGSDMSSMFLSLYPQFPERALKAGDTWSQRQELPQPQMGLVIETRYTFTREEKKNSHKCVVIDYTFSMNMQGQQETQMKVEGGGEGKGTAYFDYERGLLMESEVKMDIKMAIDPPLPIGNQKISTTTHQTIKMVLI